MRALLALVVLAVSVSAFSEPPVPTPAKASNPPKESTGQTTKESKTPQGESKNSPLPVTIDGPVTIQKSKQDRNAEASDKEHKASNEWWLVVWTGTLAGTTFLLAVITGVLATYTYLLWRDTSKASERQALEMERSLAIAKQSADAAVFSATAALASQLPVLEEGAPRLIATDENAVPCSDMTPIAMPPSAGFTIEVPFKNKGRTAAYVYRWSVRYYEGEAPPKEPDYGRVVEVNDIIEPGAISAVIRPPDRNDGANREWRVLNMPSIDLGKKSMWIYGFVSYRDFMNGLHEVGFCFRWQRDLEAPSRFVPEGGPKYRYRNVQIPPIASAPV